MRAALARGLLSASRMRTQPPRTRRTWPLYLAIAVAGTASIATTAPPTWLVEQWFQGPAVTLTPSLREQVVPFTVRLAPDDGWSEVEVRGVVQYEDADEELRIAIIEPGARTLVTQFQTIAGSGRLAFTLRAHDPFRCEPGAGDVCEQRLAVLFGTGGASTGAYTIDWYLGAKTSDDGTEPPPDLVFEAALEGGRSVESAGYLDGYGRPDDRPGDGRWRMFAGYQGRLFVHQTQAAQSLHFVVRSEGPYLASQIYIPIMFPYHEYSLLGSTTFRTTVTADDPAVGVVAEHVATVSGEGWLFLPLSLPEPLDCASGTVCERGYTITFGTEDPLGGSLSLDLDIDAFLEGDGEVPPAETRIEILADTASATGRQDG